METIAQILSIVAMIIAVLALQIKKTSMYCLSTAITCTMFAVSYFMLGSPTSAAANLICALRGGFASYKTTRKTPYCIWICTLLAASCIFTYTGVLSICVCAAEIAGTLAMWFASEKGIRYTKVFFQSPIWLVNNIIVFTIGGIVTEVFSIISAIIFLWRFRNKKA